MKTKVYVILHGIDQKSFTPYIRIPIKANESPYGTDKNYCQNIPQFFGGTVEKDGSIIEAPSKNDIEATLKKEVEEESRTSLVLNLNFSKKIITTENKKKVKYIFYSCKDWQPTEISFEEGPDNKPAYKEMQCIIDIYREVFSGLEGEAIVNKLLLEIKEKKDIEPTNTALKEFNTSETRQAFIEFITWWNSQGALEK